IIPDALRLHAPLRRRFAVHRSRPRPPGPAGPAPGREGVALHPRPLAGRAGLVPPGTQLAPRLAGRVAHQAAPAGGEADPGRVLMAELLLSCQDVTKAYGSAPLFAGLSFGIF